MREPWRGWFVAAVISFGMRPADFWALSLAEWRALTAAGQRPAPMGRAELEALIKAHGDSDEEDRV